jgi:UDP-N-acetylmuramoylalanine--D-glutamate ligase
MIPLLKRTGQTIGVLGLGRTGLSVIQAAYTAGLTVFAWDDGKKNRQEFEKALDAFMSKNYSMDGGAVWLQDFQDWSWEDLDVLVMSPGIPLTHPIPHPAVALAKSYTIPCVCDIDLFYEEMKESSFQQSVFLGVTGTNGKSTTTALLTHLLYEGGFDATAAGNIGVPVLSLPMPAGDKKGRPLDPLLQEVKPYVIEFSSYQLDLCHQMTPRVGVFLNLTPDHLDRHGDMEGYFQAKCRLFQNMTPEDIAVICVDDVYGQRLADILEARPIPLRPVIWRVSANNSMIEKASEEIPLKAWIKDGILYESEAYIASLEEALGLRGQHNAQNAVTAYAAARALGAKVTDLIRGLNSFKELPHRMEQVASADNGKLLYINDSKATNADAAEKSLSTFDGIYWIAGGQPKAGGIESLAPYFHRVRCAYLIGQAQEEFAKTLEAQGVPFVLSGTLEQAIAQATQDYKKAGGGGGVILLAPACASWDQFKSYEDRGEQFSALARDYALKI